MATVGTSSGTPPPPVTPIVVSITPNPALLDNGQTVVFTAAATGGSGLYGYSWFAANGMGCTATITQTFSCTPNPAIIAPGAAPNPTIVSPAVSVTVTDSNSDPPASASAALHFYTALSAPTMSPASAASTDQGQTITISASGNGGTGLSYTYSWALALGATCPGFSGTPATQSFTYTPAGTTSTCAFTVTVTDAGTSTGAGGSPAPTITGTTGTITVYPTLTTPNTPAIVTGTLDSDQTPQVASDAIPGSLGGSGSTVDYTWLASNTGSGGPYTSTIAVKVCSSGTVGPLAAVISTTVYCTASGSANTGTYYFEVQFSDTGTTLPPPHAFTISSDVGTTTVYPQLTAPGTPTVNGNVGAIKLDVDQTLTVSSTLSGTGAPNINWQWLVSDNGGGYATTVLCTSDSGNSGAAGTNNAVITCGIAASALTAGHYYNFELKVTSDSATTPEGPVTSSASPTVTVYPALTAPGTPTVNGQSSAISLDVNQALTVSSTLSGTGAPGINWQWLVSDNGGGYATTVLCTSGSGNSGTSGTNNAAIICGIAASALTVGHYYNFELQVTSDSATTPEGPVTSSASPTVTVTNALGATSLSPSGSITIDNGQSIVFTASWSGGASTYTADLYTSGNSGCAGGSPVQTQAGIVGTSFVFTAVTPSSFTYYCAEVADSSTPGEQTVTATATSVTVDNPLGPAAAVVTPAPYYLDQGQQYDVASATFSSSALGTGSPTYTWLASDTGVGGPFTSAIAASVCTTATGTASAGVVYCYSLTGAPTGNYYFEMELTDSSVYNSPYIVSSTSPSGEVVVSTTLLVSSPTYGHSGVDADQTFTITLTEPSTGTTPYGWVVQYSLNNGGTWSSMTGVSGCNGAVGHPWSTTCTIPNAALTYADLEGLIGGHLYLALQVTDSATNPATPNSQLSPLILTVSSDLTAGTPTYSTPHAYVYYGGTVTFTAAASGGSGGDSYVWSMDGFPGCSASVISTITCNPTSGAGTYSISYSVTDSNSNTVNSPSLNNYIVYSTPLASEPTPNTSTLDVGQSYTYSTTASGGTGSYITYTWAESSSNLGCSLANAASIICVPTSTSGEPFTLTVAVTDSNGVMGPYSGPATITVFGALSAPAITSATTPVDSGQTVTIDYNAASGGTGAFSYALYVSTSPGGPYSLVVGATCSGGVCTFTASTAISTTLYYEVQATDMGTTVPSATIFSSDTTIVLNPALGTVSISPSSLTTIDLGQGIVISGTWSSSTGSPNYVAKLYSGSTGSACLTHATLVQTLSSLPTGSATFGTVTPSGSAPFSIYYCIVVTDSSVGTPPASSSTGAVQILVNPDPTVSVTQGTFNYDQGQSPVSITATVTYTLGSGNTITVSWYQSTSPTSCAILGSAQSSGTGPVYQFTPPTTNVGTTSYCAVVTDSGVPSYSANSGSGVVTIIVHATPTVSVNGGTAYTVTYDRTQVATVTAIVTYAGSNTATVNWYESTSPSSCSTTGSSIGSEASPPYTLTIPTSSTGTTSYCAVVTDSGVPAYTSNSGSGVITVVVNPLPTVSVSSTPGPFGYDVGQSASALSAVVTYTVGSGNVITVTWYYSTVSGAAACAPGTSTGQTGSSFTPGTGSAATTYYCAVVTDSGVPSYESPSSPVTVVVNLDPTVSTSSTPGPYTYVLGATPTNLVGSVTYTFATYSPATSNVITVTWYSSTVGASTACNPSLGTPTGVVTTITSGHTTSSQAPDTSVAETTTWYCAVVTDSGVSGFHASSTAVEVIVNPSLTLNLASGIVGYMTTATGAGYIANHAVTFSLDGLGASSSCTSSNTGTIDCSVTIPAVPQGPQTMISSDGSGYTGSATFTVQGSFSMNPNQAPSGGSFTLTANGLVASTVYGTGLFTVPGHSQIWTFTVSSCTVGSVSGSSFETNSQGSATCVLEVPSSGSVAAGTYAVSTAGLAFQTFTITTPAIALNYIQGPSGSLVLLTGTGFTTSEGTITISLEISAGATLSTSSCGATDVYGGFSCNVAITGTPSGTPYTLRAAGSDSTFGGFDSATAQFTITSANGYLFTETGLSGQFWSVSIGSNTRGTSGTSVLFPSYLSGYYTVHAPYGYTASPSSGFVSGGSASVLITFTPIGSTFTATFTESGLVTGTSWTVIVGGTPYSSTGTTISVSGLTGAVAYTVQAVPGYTLSGSTSGDVTSGAHTPSVTYTPTGTPFEATFTESGLLSGVTWSVTVGPTTYQATVSGESGTTITVSGLTGTVPYTFNAATGYTITVGGSGDVSSGSPTASATYTPNGATLTVTFTQSGLPARTFWNVIVTDPNLGTVSKSTGAASMTIAGLTLGDSFSAHATEFTSCGGTVSGVSVAVTFYLGYHSCDPPQHASVTTPGGGGVGSGAVFGLLFATLAALVAAAGVGIVVLRMRSPRTKGPAPPVA